MGRSIVVVIILEVIAVAIIFIEEAFFSHGNTAREFGGFLCLDEAFFLVAEAVFPEVEEAFIHEEHAVFSAGLDGGVDAVGFVFADEVGDGGGDHHHLVGGDDTFGFFGHEGLGEHANEGSGELGSDLVLGVLWEDIDDTVDGGAGGVGMEGAEDDVTGFGSFNGGMDGFEIAHFTDEDHVGIHTERAADALFEAGDIDANFALVEEAFLVFVEVLDGVFERDDMAIVVIVDEVEHACEGGGFARAGRACDQKQATGPGDEAFDSLGHADLLEGEELAWDTAQDHTNGATLLENSDAEAVSIDKFDGEVGAAVLLEFLLVSVRRDGFHQRHGVIGLEFLDIEFAHAA